MTVYRKNITINVGETFSEDLTLLGSDGNGVVDLTGYTLFSYTSFLIRYSYYFSHNKNNA